MTRPEDAMDDAALAALTAKLEAAGLTKAQIKTALGSQPKRSNRADIAASVRDFLATLPAA